MEWINVNERLPETKNVLNWVHDSDHVLVWTDQGCKISVYTKRYRINGRGEMILEREFWAIGSKVTHWMELPKSPEI